MLILLILLGCLPNISMSVTGLPLVKMSKIIEKDIFGGLYFYKKLHFKHGIKYPENIISLQYHFTSLHLYFV